LSVVPFITYPNADILKRTILNDNKGKAGISRWTNNLNNKSYIGSSVNLSNRFKFYFNDKFIRKYKHNMLIYKILLRYGYSNFTIEILEYCDSEKCIEREQYYIDLLKPEYNILKRAGSSLGFKHTEETLAKISAANKGEKHPMYGKTHTEETLAKIAAFRKGKKHSEETLVKMAAAKKDEKNPM